MTRRKKSLQKTDEGFSVTYTFKTEEGRKKFMERVEKPIRTGAYHKMSEKTKGLLKEAEEDAQK